MSKLFILVFCIPLFTFSQSTNDLDNQGNKQGIWSKSYTNGSIRYRGQFKDNIPYGIFNL